MSKSYIEIREKEKREEKLYFESLEDFYNYIDKKRDKNDKKTSYKNQE